MNNENDKNLITPEEQQAAQTKDAETLLLEHFNKIKVPDLTPEMKDLLNQAAASLLPLRAEILEKREGVLVKKDLIREKIDALKTSKKVNIDEEEFKKFEASVNQFAHLLSSMLQEVERDIVFYSSFSSPKPPEYIFIAKTEPQDFMEHINARLRSIKKYVKNATRDLSISYSRYCYGFDAQMRHILYIEQIIKKAGSRA